MKTFYLLRHGPLTVSSGLYGVSDVSAQPKISQMIADDVIKRFGKKRNNLSVVSSPLSRCLALAQLVNHKINEFTATKRNIITNAAFQEMNFGQFDGCAFDDIPADSTAWQLLEQFWKSPAEYTLPKGEPLKVFQQRVQSAWQNLLTKTLDSSVTVIVTHGGVIRLLLAHILNEDINEPNWYQRHQIDYGCLVKITVSSGEAELNCISDTLASSKSKVAGYE